MSGDPLDPRDHFLAIVAHELRVTLAAILLWEQVLRDDRGDPVVRTRALDAIRDSATQQSQLVGDLLDVARARTGKLHVDLKPLAIDSVVASAIRAAQPAAERKQQALVYRPGGELGLVDGDANRLAQIFGNLLANAVTHTGDHGRIVVTTRRTEDAIEIEVADSGRGITAELLPRVFDPFSQADGGTLDGLGLGLAIARDLVLAHRGTLTASSPGPDRGATFTVTLPRSLAYETHAP